MANLAILCVCFPCTIAYWIVGNAVTAIGSLFHTEYEQCESAQCDMSSSAYELSALTLP
jgi:hypothetical protein